MRCWPAALCLVAGCGPVAEPARLLDGKWSGPLAQIGKQEFDLYLEISTAPCADRDCAAGFWLNGVSGPWGFDCWAEVDQDGSDGGTLALRKMESTRACAAVLGDGPWEFAYRVDEETLVLDLPRGSPEFQREHPPL